jgi:hypothetical protein
MTVGSEQSSAEGAMPRYFSVDEANRTLPLVQRVVSDVVSTHRKLMARVDEYRGLDRGRPDSTARRRELEQEIGDLGDQVNGFIRELEEVGALLKGFENGLVDFYGVLDGRPIFLCWKLGEESIEWWHELDGGYAGRRRLPAHLLSPGGGE